MTFLMEKDLYEQSVKVKVTAQDFYAAFFISALCNMVAWGPHRLCVRQAIFQQKNLRRVTEVPNNDLSHF